MRPVTSDAVLARIRQLLAKAESTTFEAEALAFTAKAQELMTRHAIDVATLQGHASGQHDGPINQVFRIDAPYIKAKAMLLQTVARAGRCRTVYDADNARSHVAGFAEDIAAVELLFTSLLVQAQTALTEVARHAPAGTDSRSRAYRSAFLQGFTHRIGQRLQDVNETVYASVVAERGDAFLPVLRSREEEVDEYCSTTFDVVSSRTRGRYNAAGWAGGTLAANNAQLGAGAVDRRSAEAASR